MRALSVFLILFCLFLMFMPEADAVDAVPAARLAESATFPAEKQYCLACHEGIEPTRPMGSGMMQAILAKGRELGDPNGCVVCHAGTPAEIKE
jgi:cytochrome c551/c552